MNKPITFGALAVLVTAVFGSRYHAVHNISDQVEADQVEGQIRRGEILDRNGYLLAGNIPVKSISINIEAVALRAEEKARENGTAKIDEMKDITKRLAIFLMKELNIPKYSVREFYRRALRGMQLIDGKVAKKSTIVMDDVDFMLAKKLEESLTQADLAELIITKTYPTRYYPKDELLAHTLGFVNEGGSGSGLEVHDELDDGNNLHLTIDEVIQGAVEQQLEHVMEKWKPRSAYAVVADPATGDILAIAQRPTFNPNDRSTFTPDRYRNRLVEDTFEPGALLQPLVMAKALDSGVITAETKIDCENGVWNYKDAPLKDFIPAGILNPVEIIQRSSFIGTAKIALRMGNIALYNALVEFGLTEHTGAEFDFETRGIMHKLEKWDDVTPTRVCNGKWVNTSVLQLVRAYCGLANKGRLPRMRLIDSIEAPESGSVEEMPDAPGKQLYTAANTHRIVRDMLKLTTQPGGTAAPLALPGFYSVVQTAAAPKNIYNRGYSNTKVVSSCIGFAPADNPRFVVLVVVDEPQGSHNGVTVAGPAYQNIMREALRYCEVEPDYFKQ